MGQVMGHRVNHSLSLLPLPLIAPAGEVALLRHLRRASLAVIIHSGGDATSHESQFAPMEGLRQFQAGDANEVKFHLPYATEQRRSASIC